METSVDEIAPQIYRFSTFIPQAGIVFNQFLIDADEPLLFHTGQRQLFPQVQKALARVIEPARLRWITFSHYEADESGAMNEWLNVATEATIAHGTIGCRTSINDQANRQPRSLEDNDIFDLGDTASSPRLGRRPDLRRNHQDAVHQRPVHPPWRRRPRNRGGHRRPGPRHGRPRPRHRPHTVHRPNTPPPRRAPDRRPSPHARPGVPRRRPPSATRPRRRLRAAPLTGKIAAAPRRCSG